MSKRAHFRFNHMSGTTQRLIERVVEKRARQASRYVMSEWGMIRRSRKLASLGALAADEAMDKATQEGRAVE